MSEYREKNEFYLPWNYGDGYMGLDEGYFKWSSEFIKDLLVLKNLGVQGYVICYGEEGEYSKYEINAKALKNTAARLSFQKSQRRS